VIYLTRCLYLLKINAVETVRHLAIIIGRGESTIHRWLHQYKIGGMSLLLEEPPKVIKLLFKTRIY
jgi:hypothetical protein